MADNILSKFLNIGKKPCIVVIIRITSTRSTECMTSPCLSPAAKCRPQATVSRSLARSAFIAVWVSARPGAPPFPQAKCRRVESSPGTVARTHGNSSDRRSSNLRARKCSFYFVIDFRNTFHRGAEIVGGPEDPCCNALTRWGLALGRALTFSLKC